MGVISFKEILLKGFFLLFIFLSIFIVISIIDPSNNDDAYDDDAYKQTVIEYTSGLVNDLSEKLPLNLIAGRLVKARAAGDFIFFDAKINSNTSYGAYEKYIANYICNDRPIRVAIIHGVDAKIRYTELTTGNNRELRINESLCKNEYGSMRNYSEFEIDKLIKENNIQKAQKNPKMAAYTYLTFLHQKQDLSNRLNCGLSTMPSKYSDFSYYWSLLTLQLPPRIGKQDYFVAKTKAALKDKHSLAFKKVASNFGEMLTGYFKEVPLEEGNICNRLETSYQNILERQLATLISCTEGLCEYGGGSNVSTLKAFSGAHNIYRDGHPVTSMGVYAFATDGIKKIVSNPKCAKKNYKLPDNILFVAKFNAIYDLEPPSNEKEALLKIKEVKTLFLERNVNGKKLLDDWLERIRLQYPSDMEESKFCDLNFRGFTHVINEQLNNLDRCLKGTCKNDHTP